MKDKKIQGKEEINLKLQNKKKVQKLKENGITLIALVVTIIILLILIGVTISQISGENGLIKRAKEAVERYKNASEEEQIQLGQLEQYVSDFSVVGENENEELKQRISELEKRIEELESKPIIRIPLGTERTINVKEVAESYIKDNKIDIDATKIDWTSLTKDNFSVEINLEFSYYKHYVIPSTDCGIQFIKGKTPEYNFSSDTGMLDIKAEDYQVGLKNFENNTWHALYGFFTITTHSYLFL